MSQDRPLESRRVLVVEDQYLLAADIRDWLEAAGAIVVGPVPSAAEACALIKSDAVDTAVVDINLGEGPTYQVARELLARSVPFLFATGYDGGSIPDDFETTARLEKPFKSNDLVAAIQALDRVRN
jgi:DNA-binding response OmpR family regulator